MSTELVPFRFNGLLDDGQTTGQQSAPYDRVLKRVQLSMGNSALPPQSDCQVQVSVNGTVVAQIFTLPTGTRYADLPCTISIPAGIQFYWTALAKAGASDLDILCSLDSGAVAPSGADVDCGLGMLSAIKAHVLAAPLQAQSEYDMALQVIALGVAGQINTFLNRKLVRTVNAIEEYSGDRDHVFVEHAPLETVNLFEVDWADGNGFSVATGWILSTAANGKVTFAGIIGYQRVRLRLTVTGGYWYDQTSDHSGSLPAGATPLPPEITLAWLTQIEHIWQNRDNLGITLLESGSRRFEKSRLQNAELIPMVKELLRNFVRYQLT